jgi:predicted nicotinamide N-methyase
MSRERGFILGHTTLRPVPGLEEIRLHLGGEVLPLWRALQEVTGDPDTPLPYWAFAWVGGLAIGRFLRDHPDSVAGRRVLDFAAGSGLCAVSAARAGAASVSAVDIDPFAVAAIRVNARSNHAAVSTSGRDMLDEAPPDVDVILAGDCWYEAELAARVLPWLQRARSAGVDVLVGDAGRRYLPEEALVQLASYDVRTTTELEDMDLKRGRVFALRDR